MLHYPKYKPGDEEFQPSHIVDAITMMRESIAAFVGENKDHVSADRSVNSLFLDTHCILCDNLVTNQGCLVHGKCSDCWPKWRDVIISGHCEKYQNKNDFLKNYFDRVVVVNLERRPDRMTDLLQKIKSNWPFKFPQRFNAIDGNSVPHPVWWKSGGGAWGCLQSHLSIIEKCLNENTNSVLILEDDLVLCDDFTAKVEKFLNKLPADWEMIYLGGQHLKIKKHPPIQINDFVVQPYNVNRTHAYALNRDGMRKVYRHLHRKDWIDRHHIDHHLGQLHASGEIKVYCPREWLIGQAEDKSNVAGREVRERWWNNYASSSFATPAVVAVIGPMRSGTSMIAGVLHKLGVSMGNRFVLPNSQNPRGFYEAIGLRNICLASYKEPRMEAINTQEERIRLLYDWAYMRRVDGPLIGAKHPSLCVMIPEISKAWANLKTIAINRPIPDILKSLKKTGWFSFENAQQEQVIRDMIQRRDDDLATQGIDTLRLTFAIVVDDPVAAIDSIIAFCELLPTSEQRADAISHIDPILSRVEV